MATISVLRSLTKRMRIAGAIGIAAAGGLLVLGGSAISQSVTPQSVDPLQHFLDCAGVLITNPDVHAANCLPSNVPPGNSSLSEPVEECLVHDVVDDDAVSDCYPYPDGVDDSVQP